MKRLLLFLAVVLITTLQIKGQPVSSMPTFTGNTTGAYMPIIIPVSSTFSNRKFPMDSLLRIGKYTTDSTLFRSLIGNSVDTTYLSNRINLKQDLLVSGTDIKTVNGNSLLGSGDLVVSGGGGASVDSILIILAGESNGGGLAPNASATTWELAARDSVYILNNNSLLFEKLHIGTNNNIDVNGLNNTTHGLELGLSNLVNTQTSFFNNRLKIIKIAQGGATLSSWATNGTWFAKAKARIRSAKTQIDFSKYKVYIFLSFGINDAAGGTTTAAYKTGLVNHINDLRSEIGQGAIPTVITKFETIGGSMSAYNTAMGEIANENTNIFAIGTAGLGSVDANHWNYSAFKIIADSTINRFKSVVTYDNITTLPAAGQGITMTGNSASIGNSQDDSAGIFTQNRYVKTGTYKLAYNGNGYGFSIDNQIFNVGVNGGTNWTAINPVGQESYLKMIGYNSIDLQSANLIEFATLKSNSNNVVKLQYKNGVNAFSTHNQESNFVGYNAGINENGSGYSNNALGSLALGDITAGQFNTGIGLQVLRYNTVGSHNISIGTLSGIRTDAGQHGSYNIFLGEYAASGSTAGGLDNFDSTLIIHSTTGYGNLQPLIRGKFSSIGQNKLGINLYDKAPASQLHIQGDVSALTPVIIENLPTYADNTAAAALPTGGLYRTSTGVLMVKY